MTNGLLHYLWVLALVGRVGMSDFHESHRASGLQGRSQPGLSGVGLTIITVLGQRQGSNFLGFIKQIAGCFGHASLYSQLSVDANCGQEVRQRERRREAETAAGTTQPWEARPTLLQVPGLSNPLSPEAQILVLRPSLPSVAQGEHNVSAHLPGAGGPPCSSACARQGMSAFVQSHSLL